MEVLQERSSPTIEDRLLDRYEQSYNDVTTLAAEVLEGQMETSFEFDFDGKEELYAQDGRALGEVFEKAETDAYIIARNDPRLECEIRRRGDGCEKGEYRDMINMANGHGPNTMVVVSDPPPELNDWDEDVGGYNIQRKQTMLRVICRLPNGKIRITSQSLDQSDREGLEKIYEYFGLKPEPGELLGQRIKEDMDPERQDLLTDELTREYDRKLEEKFGGRYHAGRTPADMDNTYQFVCQQKDLISVFMRDSNDENLFGLIAALENRWNNRKVERGVARETESFVFIHEELPPELEMQHTAQRAIQQGKTYSGCGVTMTGPSEAEDQLETLGYGNQTIEKQEWYGKYKKTGTCVNCHEGPKDVGEKNWCKNCISGHCGTK